MSIKKIKGLYFDKDFKGFLNKNKEASIHSIFEKVVNIKSNDNILYTISNVSTDNAPYTLKTDYNGSFKEVLKKDDKVLKQNNKLILGKIEIDLIYTDLWNVERENLNSFSVSTINKNIKFFNVLIDTIGKDGGCKYYYIVNKLALNKENGSLIEKELFKRIDNFYEKLKTNNLTKEDVNNLIGVGMGLTPSGDDFLTGFLCAISIFEKNEEIFEMLKTLIIIKGNSTTDVSSAMLKAAIEGKYREYLNNFTYSFLDDDKDKFLKDFKNLLKIGSSSGTDMSVGVVLGFLYTIQSK